MTADTATAAPTTVTPLCEVYSHTCHDGLTYVGFTKNTMEQRFTEHCDKARKGSHLEFHEAIRRVGEDGFRSRVLFVGPEAEARAQEIEWIAKLGTVVPGGYNVSEGGDGGNMGEAWAERTAEANRKKAADPAWRARHAAATKDNPEWRARKAAKNRKMARDPAWLSSNGADLAAPAPIASACAALLANAKSGRDTLSNACMDIVLLYPEVPGWQLMALAVAAGHKRNTAQLGYTKATGAAQVLGDVALGPDQTAAAAVAAWPAVLAEAEAMKAAQVEGGKTLVGTASGATKLALTLLSLRFAAVPSSALARALADAHGVDSSAREQMRQTRAVAARAIALGKDAGMCPVLIAALSEPVPARHPSHPAVAAARAAQAAAIDRARAVLVELAA